MAIGKSQSDSSSTSSSSAITSLNVELKSQLDLLNESFLAQLDQIKQTALKARRQTDGSHEIVLAASDPILHWAEVEVQNQQLKQIVATKRNPSWTPAVGATSGAPHSFEQFEQNYLTNVIKKIDFMQLRADSTSIVRVRQDAEKRLPLLSMGFFIPGTKDQAQQLFIVALINPVEAFPIFARFGNLYPNGSRKAFLVAKDGQVVAHSQTSYSGTNIKNTELFANAIFGAFSQTSPTDTTSTEKTYRNIDDLQVRTAYSKVKGLPFALVLEQSANAARTSSLSQQLIVGPILTLIGMICVGAALWYLRRQRNREPLITTKLPELLPIRDLPSEVNQAISRSASAQTQQQTHIQVKRESFQKISQAPKPTFTKKNREPADSLSLLKALSKDEIIATCARFETMAHQIRDPRITAAMLCQASSQIAQSPTLYFKYQTQTRLMLLENDWGFAPGREPVSMAFPVPLNAIKRIQTCATQNKLASLSNFEPLTSLILTREGVACFEAWAITTPVRSYQIAPQVLGVLVILNSGIHSTQNRDFVVKMMKTVGTLYEGPSKSTSKPKIIPSSRQPSQNARPV